MRIVLENSPRRKSLLTSPVIDRNDVTGIHDDIPYAIHLYPNPTKDWIHISIDKQFWGSDFNVAAYTLLGKMVFNKTLKITDTGLEIPISEVRERLILLSIEGPGLSYKQLVMIN